MQYLPFILHLGRSLLHWNGSLKREIEEAGSIETLGNMQTAKQSQPSSEIFKGKQTLQTQLE
jgi:hypothetical protein